MTVSDEANMPPTPWQTEIRAPGFGRGRCRIWRTLSCSAYMPYMPECMKERPPPLVLSGSLPPGAVLRLAMKRPWPRRAGQSRDLRGRRSVDARRRRRWCLDIQFDIVGRIGRLDSAPQSEGYPRPRPHRQSQKVRSPNHHRRTSKDMLRYSNYRSLSRHELHVAMQSTAAQSDPLKSRRSRQF